MNIDAEIQQRAIEYDQIFGLGKERAALLEKIPVLESALQEETLKGTGTALEPQAKDSSKTNELIGGGELLGNIGVAKPAGKEDIMDILGGLNLTGSASAPSPVVTKANTVDLLGDLFGSGPTSSPGKSQSSQGVLDLLGSVPASVPAPVAAVTPTFSTVACYEKNGLLVALLPFKESPIITQIKATFTSSVNISNLLFQVAVPKVFSILTRLLNCSCNQRVEIASLRACR